MGAGDSRTGRGLNRDARAAAGGTALTTKRAAHRQVWRLAGPIMLSNVSVPLMGAVDTAVMGHLPDPAFIGAVAVGAVVFNFLFWGFGFLRMGTTGFAAQAFGAGDRSELRAGLLRALFMAGAIAVALLILQRPIAAVGLHLFEASAAVETLAERYFTVRIWSAPATLANYAVLGWLLGVQAPKRALLIQIIANSTNIALCLLFVLGLGWDVRGVALANVLSEYLGLGLGLSLVASALRPGAASEAARILDRARMAALLKVNGDIFVRTICLIAAFAYFTALGARMGDVVLAANAVLLNLQTMMAYALDAFAHAAEILAGSALGARNRRAFTEAVRVATVWSAGFALATALLYLLFGRSVIALFTALPEVRAAGAAFLPWIIVSPLVSVWSYLLDGVFIGATRTTEMRNGMLMSGAAFVAAVWLLLPLWGNHGLWAALMIFMAVRGLTLAAWYPRIVRTLAP